MKFILAAGAVLLAYAALPNPADARIMAGPSMSPRMTTTTDYASRIGQSNSGRHYKKFNDDMPDDPPPKKTPTGTTGSGAGGGTTNPYDPYGFHSHPPKGGWYDKYGHYHPWNPNTPPLACKGRPC